MRVNICGIQHEIIERDDNFDIDYHFGQIDYKKNEIRINKALTNGGKKEGTNIWQYESNGTDAQKWIIKKKQYAMR